MVDWLAYLFRRRCCRKRYVYVCGPRHDRGGASVGYVIIGEDAAVSGRSVPMDFELSPKVQRLQAQLRAFMEREVYRAEKVFEPQLNDAPSRWQIPPVMEELKRKARAEGLWNLFLPESELGAGLTNLEYAPLCEIMGRSPIAPEAFNCSAPDTGNMETLVRYATPEQQERWLKPLLA